MTDRQSANRKLCEKCGGAGTLEPPELQGVDARFPVEFTCDACNGTGLAALAYLESGKQ